MCFYSILRYECMIITCIHPLEYLCALNNSSIVRPKDVFFLIICFMPSKVFCVLSSTAESNSTPLSCVPLKQSIIELTLSLTCDSSFLIPVAVPPSILVRVSLPLTV